MRFADAVVIVWCALVLAALTCGGAVGKNLASALDADGVGGTVAVAGDGDCGPEGAAADYGGGASTSGNPPSLEQRTSGGTPKPR